METPPIPPSDTPEPAPAPEPEPTPKIEPVPEPAPEAPLPPSIPSKEDRTWAMCAHLSALTGHFIPFGQIFGPLIVWLLRRDELELLNDQGKEALNAQISFTIYFAISIALMLTLVGIVIGLPLFAILWLADLILIIIAAVSANEGKRYRYPFIFRWIK